MALLAAAGSARADFDAGKAKVAEVCSACHGADGNSRDERFPIIAGQTYRYITLQLRDFKEGRRHDAMMDPIAASLGPDDIRNVAEYLSQQKAVSTGFRGDSEKVEAGRHKVEETLCTMCHQGGFGGQNEMPRVAGQYEAYVIKQLRAFKARSRTNDAGNMTAVASTLSDHDILNVSEYIANLY